MATHIVEQGECLSSLAARVGLQAQDLHNHPANADLKKLRPYPNILAPGDIVEIPDPEQKAESASTDKTSRFVIHSPKVKLRIAMLDYLGNPYAGKRYVVTVGKQEIRGKTASDGLIECDVPADAQQGHLRVWFDDADPAPHIDRDLLIGHLDPIDLISGVQARLDNLGFPCSDSGQIDNFTLAALRRFRAANQLADPPALKTDDCAPPPHLSDSSATDWVSAANNSSPDIAAEGDSRGSSPADPIDTPLRSKLQGLYEAR